MFCKLRPIWSVLMAALIPWGLVNGQDWDSIRGPHFDGSATVDDTVLSTGPLQMKVVWKRSWGSGYSGIVKKGDILVSAMADPDAGQEFLVAVDANTGKTRWKTATGKVMKGENGSFDGPLATPAVDGEHAYHLSPFGDLTAYSLQDGAVVWTHNLKQEYSAEPNFYGFGASPIIHAGLLIVVAGSPEGAIMGFDCKTGERVWKAGVDGAAFQSPVPVEIDGQTVILAAGNTRLFAIHPDHGKLLWSQSHSGISGSPAWAIIPAPVSGGGIFLNDHRDHSSVVDLTAEGAQERWTGRDIRNTYCVPVNAGGLLCSYSSRFLVAVDPKTGKRVWRTRSPGNGFLATIAGRLVVATLDGSLHIGDVSRSGFEEVAALQVFDSSTPDADGLMWALPTVAGRSVYLRSLNAIARVDIQPGRFQSNVAQRQSEVSAGFAEFLEKLQLAQDPQRTIDDYLTGRSLPLIDGEYVHFLLQGDFDDVAVASELFGIRQERSMIRAGDTDLFYFGLRLPEPTRAAYVFYADYQPITDPLNARQVVSTTITGEMEPNFMGPATPLTFSWFDQGDLSQDLVPSTDSPSTQLAGTLQTRQLKSKSMNETIELSIYLPPGYAESDADYPVVFVHEGKVAMESGNQAAILDELIQTKAIRPSIAVFIQRRFYPMMGANGYPEMFSTELLPMVEQAYRVSDNRDDRASLSGGFGATLAMMGTLPASEQVGRIGCHSPFSFEMLHPVLRQLSNLPNPRCEILIQWGKYEFRNPSENWNMATQAQAIAEMLREGGHRVTAESIATGSDWVCWRTQSARMWRFLVGE